MTAGIRRIDVPSIRGLENTGKVVFAALFVMAGIGHFVRSDFFVRIMPPYLPWHRTLVFVSGVIEILLGILLLVPRFSRMAAWGLIALLLAVFPANIHVYLHQRVFPLHPALHLARLPLQGVLILWAYLYTKRAGKSPERATEVGSTADGD